MPEGIFTNLANKRRHQLNGIRCSGHSCWFDGLHDADHSSLSDTQKLTPGHLLPTHFSLALLQEPGVAQDPPHFFRRNGQAIRNSGYFLSFSCPHLGNDDFRKLFGYLLKGLISYHSFRPGTKCLVNTGGAQDMRLQSDEFLPEMISIVGTEERGGLGRAFLGHIPLLKEVVGSS